MHANYELEQPTVRRCRQAAPNTGVQIEFAHLGVDNTVDCLAQVVKVPEIPKRPQLIVGLDSDLVASIGHVRGLGIDVERNGAVDRAGQTPVEIWVDCKCPAA